MSGGQTRGECLCHGTDVRANVPAGGEGALAMGLVGRGMDSACRSRGSLAGALLRSEAEVRRMESLQGHLEGGERDTPIRAHAVNWTAARAHRHAAPERNLPFGWSCAVIASERVFTRRLA